MARFEKCDKCSEPGRVYNDDGEFLCEDCMMEWAVEETMPTKPDSDFR